MSSQKTRGKYAPAEAESLFTEHTGRPDFDRLVEDLAAHTGNGTKSGVFVSGPERMVNELELRITGLNTRPFRAAKTPGRLLQGGRRRSPRLVPRKARLLSKAPSNFSRSTGLLKATSRGLHVHMTTCDVHNLSFEL